jgi:hypothetical protein
VVQPQVFRRITRDQLMQYNDLEAYSNAKGCHRMIPVRRSFPSVPITVLALLTVLLLAGLGPVQAAPRLQNSQRITYDIPVTGQITFEVTEEAWVFDGAAGDVVLIDMRANEGSSLDCYLSLLDPSGLTMMTNDDGGEGLNSRIGPLPLPENGEYTVLASNYNGTGAYTLEVKNLNTIPMLAQGKPLVGMVNVDHPVEYFRLAVAPDQDMALVQLTVSDDEATTNPYITVYGGAGLIASTEYEESATVDPIALLPGQSYVAVIAWNPYSNGGPYELTLAPSEIGIIEDGVPQTGAMDYDTYTQQHFFVAEAGDLVHVVITAEGDISPALDVYSADHSQFVFSADGEHVRSLEATLEIPDDGVYIVEIFDGSFAGQAGTYELTITWQD